MVDNIDGNVTKTYKGTYTQSVTGNHLVTSKGQYNHNVTGTFNMISQGVVTITGTQIYLN